MACPKCGRPRVPGPECPHCGIVYGKARPPPPEQVPGPLPGAPERPRPARRAVGATVAAAAVAGVVAVFGVVARRPASEPSTQSPEPVAAVQGSTRAAEERGPATSGASPSAVASEPTAVAAEPAAVPGSSGAAPTGRSATEAPAPEPASCTIYSLARLQETPRRPSVSAAWHEGASGFRRAKEEQASTGAPLLVLFQVGWCPHCRRFASEVIPSAEMRELGDRIVKAKVDAEGDAEERELARQLSVTSYPTLLVFAAPGRPPERIRAWSPPRTFVESCERVLSNPAREHLARGVSLSRGGAVEQAVPELEAAAADPRVAALALDHLGVLALKAGCFAPAAAIYTRVLELDPGYDGGRGNHLRGFARLRSGDPSRALDDLDRACQLGFAESCPLAQRLRERMR